MRICFITKYPPIQGGVSSRAYWQAKALGEHGHEVHIVTNSLEVEEDYKEVLDFNDSEFLPENVFLHSTNIESNPWHIPYSPAYAERIANLAIEVIQNHDIQIIDSNFILPYGIAGNIAKCITGVPQVLRHAGSDIGKLYKSSSYNTLFKSLFHRVDKILTYPQLQELFISEGIPESKISIDDQVIVDTRAFNPNVDPFPISGYTNTKFRDCPIITYIGKINYYWQSKGLLELIEAVTDINEDFILLFVAGGRGLKEFKELLNIKGLMGKSLFLNFLPPWKIPAIIKLSTCVVVPERDFPFQYHVPILPREVMAIGKCLILSNELNHKIHYGELIDGENAFLIDPKNIRQFHNVMKLVIENPDIPANVGRNGYENSKKIENFDEFITDTIDVYSSLIEK